MKVHVYGSVVASHVDGPGMRAVVHFAGCSLRCPGCFNQDLWDRRGPAVHLVEANKLASDMLAISSSVTISGGEPTEQMLGLVDLLHSLRSMECDDIVMFSGHRLGALRRASAWQAIEAGNMLDVLIDGRFRADLIETGSIMRGSSNQRIHCLTSRWEESDFEDRGVQVLLDEGRVVVTGFPEAELLEAI